MKLNCYLFLCIFLQVLLCNTYEPSTQRSKKGNEVTDIVKHVDAQNEAWVF